MRVLRDYQAEAVQAVTDGWAATGGEPQAIVLPTGTGKTDVIAALSVAEARAGGRALVLADREELLDQVTERVGMHDPRVSIGRVQAATVQGRRQVVTAMVQTLRSPRRQAQCLKPSLVIVDECDLATADGYTSVFDWAGPVRRMGVTATLSRPRPKRGERGLGDVWPHVAFSRDIEWAVREGWLVRPRGRVVVADHMDLAHAKVRAGDYTDGELGEMVAQDTPQIVAAWLEHGEDRITGAYWPTIEACRAGCEAFNLAGVKSEMVIGSTGYAERQGIYARLSAGVTRMVHSVGVLTRGWDCPPLSCILMARPTKMRHLYQQIIGRGLRPSPGKVDCLVLDVVGTTRVNDLATLIDLYRAADVEDERPVELTYCPDCSYPIPSPGLRVSPVCTCTREKAERDPNGGREKLSGPAKYIDLDLFAGREVVCKWQTSRRAGRMFTAVGDRVGVLWPVPGGWEAGHLRPRAMGGPNPFDAQRLGAFRDLAVAKRAVEKWAQSYDADDLARRLTERAAQRRAAPHLLRAAERLKIVGAERMTAARVQEEIDRARASACLDYL